VPSDMRQSYAPPQVRDSFDATPNPRQSGTETGSDFAIIVIVLSAVLRAQSRNPSLMTQD